MRVRSRKGLAARLIGWGLVAAAPAGCATTSGAGTGAPPAEGPIGGGDPTLELTATLRLENPRLACGAPALRFMRGDELLAVLGPDDRAELAVPVGRYVITVHDGRASLDHTVDVPPEGATLSPGCFADPFHHGGLFPLTLVGPDAACGVASVRARAGGLLVELTVGERETLWLPPASHIVKVLDEGKRGRETTVDLTAGGAELPLATCPGAAGETRAP